MDGQKVFSIWGIRSLHCCAFDVVPAATLQSLFAIGLGWQSSIAASSFPKLEQSAAGDIENA
jgi:hypothetical protein